MTSLTLFNIFCVIILIGVATTDADDCECKEHIFCLYPTSNPGPACKNFKSYGFVEEEKDRALRRINEYRNTVALGKEIRGSPGPQPPAADMMEVTWDYYLESTAQRYADQCIFEHSKCRVTDNYKFGENLAWGKRGRYSDAYLRHIKNWYDEVKDFPRTLVNSYDKSNVSKHVQIGHYAQLINAKTYHIGCGKSQWGDENLLVCHFGPTIYIKKPVYTIGTPASMCHKGAKSSYEGLCALGSRSSSSILMVFHFCLLFTSIL